MSGKKKSFNPKVSDLSGSLVVMACRLCGCYWLTRLDRYDDHDLMDCECGENVFSDDVDWKLAASEDLFGVLLIGEEDEARWKVE